jgi:hypothetical protein
MFSDQYYNRLSSLFQPDQQLWIDLRGRDAFAFFGNLIIAHRQQ